MEDVIKDLELRRPSWIIQVGPKFNNKCTYQRSETEEEKRKTHRGSGCDYGDKDCSDEVTSQGMARTASSHQKLEKAR